MEVVQREAFCPQGSQTEPYFTYVPTQWRRGNGTNSLKHLVSQNTKTPMRDSLHPDPWPNLGIVIVDPDTCIGPALQLEGAQNINLPPVGSKLHAAPPTP